MLAMFLVVGCQTTQSAETETEPKVVKKVENLPEQEDLPEQEEQNSIGNPFENMPIPPGAMVNSVKPVSCGRLDKVMETMQKQYGEKPVFVGKSVSSHPSGEQIKTLATLLFNEDTGSWTFLEQMPTETRFMCLLSGGDSGKTESLLLKKEPAL